MTESLALLVPALASALLHFLWQGALVGLLAWLALALLRDARPQARHAVACLALLACLLLPAWQLVQGLPGSSPSVVRVALDAGGRMPQGTGALDFLRSPSTDTLGLLVMLWAAGVATLSLRMACGLLWVGRMRRQATDGASGRWQECIDALASRLGITRRVALRMAHDADSPVTAGWWRPVVLLPVAVAARMPADLVEALLAHELAHVRRHDYLVNLLQSAVEALLFYHPVVWWLSHRIRTERELVADDLAAHALGDRRRLAVALSELERIAPAPVPLPHYAPAAHGGHLMSRIQHLLRPERRTTGTAIVLPVIGLALAGVAFYAHARLAEPGATAAPTTTPAAIAQALPAPAAKPGARVLPTPDARAAPGTSSYALVRGDRDGITMSGELDDADEIRLVRGSIDGDFLWFRRDGKAWVVRDAATVARAREAWADTDALGGQMQALEARMKPHGARMEALAERMEALDDDNVFESPEARAATERMEALGEQAEALAERQVALAERMHEATEAGQANLERERERDALEREQDALHRQMEQHATTLQSLSARMDAQHAPMEALAREMEAASQPMEVIGEEMEALGERIEAEAEVADRQVRQLIDEAYRSGRAQPAPVRQ